jgi:hypothetical protein
MFSTLFQARENLVLGARIAESLRQHRGPTFAKLFPPNSEQTPRTENQPFRNFIQVSNQQDGFWNAAIQARRAFLIG